MLDADDDDEVVVDEACTSEREELIMLKKDTIYKENFFSQFCSISEKCYISCSVLWK